MHEHTWSTSIAEQIRELAAAHGHAAATLREWWSALAERRLSFPAWPAPFGHGWDSAALAARSTLFGELGLIGPPPGLGSLMGAPIVIDHGTPEQQQRWLRPLADGTVGWCQLFSEPGAGSDLAGLTTTAERDGDDWVVTGQKVWTSGATHADAGMLIARTNWDVPKHRGLSYFIIPMDQPGVEVRPLKQMNGASHFSEVFFDEARVSDTDRVGDVGSGWAIATATLGYERRGLGAANIPGPRPEPGELAGQLDRTIGDILNEHGGHGNEPVAAFGSSERLTSIGRQRSTLDAGLRQDLAALACLEGTDAMTARRQPLVAKLAWTERLRRASATSSRAAGASAMLTESADDPVDPAVREAAGFVLSVPSASIAGGTDEVQRNIIGERALGLPREPSPDHDLPFREVPRNA